MNEATTKYFSERLKGKPTSQKSQETRSASQQQSNAKSTPWSSKVFLYGKEMEKV